MFFRTAKMPQTRKVFLLIFVFATALGLSDVSSQEKAADQPLTLEECIQLALKNRPELQILALDVLNAEFQILEAASYYYPHLNLEAGYTRFNRPTRIDVDVDTSEISVPLNAILPLLGVPLSAEFPSSIHQEFDIGKENWAAVSVNLNQPLYTFGRIKEGVKQANIGHSIALNQKEKKRNEIIFEVKKGYVQLLFSKELLHLIKEAEARAGIVVKMVKIAYETSVPEKGEKGTTRVDYLKAKNFHSEVKAKLSEAQKNVKLADLAFKMALGVDNGYPIRIVEVPIESLSMDINDLGEVKEKIVGRNTDLKNIELGVQFYDSKRKAANKEYLPKIGIQGQYIGPEDRLETRNFWYLGIGITMPIFDGFLTRAKIGQAEVQFNKTRGQKLLLESALSLQADYLYATLEELKEKVEILRAAAKEAQERMQLAADGYAAGATEYEELLLAQKAELEIKSGYLQNLYLFQITKSETELISEGYGS